MAGPTLGDRTRVKTTKVFFGNLSYFCSAQDVHELLLTFVPSSRIYSVDVCKTKAHDPLYYGFVHLLDAQTAAQVIETLNGRLFMGRQLRVHSGAKSATAPAKDNSAGSSFQVLFSFVCGRSPHVLAEEQFRAIFLAHGRVKDCVIKSYYRHAQGGSAAPQPSSEHADHSGYGFVCVDELAAAHRLVAIFQRTTITVGLSFGGRPPVPVTLEIDCKLSYQTASIAEPPSAHLASPMSCASSATGSTGSAAPPAAFAELQLPPLGGSMAPRPAAPRLQPQQPVMVWMVPASQSPPSPAGPCNAPHGGWPMPPFYRAPSPMMMPMMMASSPPLSSSPPAFFSFASPPLAPPTLAQPSAPAPPAFFYYSPPASPSQQFDPRRPAASHM